ncbi:MAG: transcription antitermination factor NusB [Phycisphaerales bacterium]
MIASQVRRYPDLVPDPELDGGNDRDSAFSHAILDAVLRRWITLEFLLELGMRSPIRGVEADVRAILLVGAAQLLFLDRVPPHAAIDQSVREAKARVREGAGGLVNAVLRRVAELRGDRIDRPPDWTARSDILVREDGGAVALSRAVFPEEQTRRLAVQTGLPRGVVERWVTSHGFDRAAGLALKTIAPAPTILNVEAAPEISERLRTEKLAVPHSSGAALVWRSDRAHLKRLLDATGVWVQDPSSAHVVRFIAGHVEPSAVRSVVDLCAGQGTKTRQLLRAFPKAQITAADVDPRRLDILSRTFAGHSRVKIMDARVLAAGFPGANLVLLDVPCSNSGVLARRVEARHRLNGRSVGELVELQLRIAAAGAALLAPGGWLAYSTCSIEPEEDQQQRESITRLHGLGFVAENLILPEGGPGMDASLARDGSYAALFRRLPPG